MNRYHNILFDLDGTLIDTKYGVINSVKKTLHDLSLPIPSDEHLEGFIGPPLEQCFMEVCGLSFEQTQKSMPIYLRYYRDGGIYDAKPYDGMAELLRQLQDAGCRLGVATSKKQRSACIMLKHFGLDVFFDGIAGAPENSKAMWTKKDSVLLAMSGFDGANAENTVLVGDRKFDAQGASEAGIDAIGVLFGYGKIDELEASPFKAIAADIVSLRELL
jgi:phosphoglycolate phosphatase